jgi:hypothetical protein
MSGPSLSLYEEFSSANPTLSDESVVRAICDSLLDEAEEEPPVAVGLLASLCGIVEVEQRPDGPAGMLIHTPRGWVASVLADDGPERQRFTILHEGGHTLMPDFKRVRRYHRCKGARTREEQLCDVAAAELLLPRRFFVPDLADVAAGLDGVESLSITYEASIQATALRAVDLASGPSALIVLSFGHKPAERGREDRCEPRLRLAWAHTAGPWPFARRHKSVEVGSPLARAWEGEYVEEAIDVDELFAEPVGRVTVSARRYGDKVLALARRPRRRATA